MAGYATNYEVPGAKDLDFSFVTIRLSGHMVPNFTPEPALALFERFLAGKAGAKTPDEGTVSTMHLLFAALEGNGRYYGSDAKRSPLEKYRSPGSPPYEGP